MIGILKMEQSVETVNLNKLTCEEGGAYLFGGSPFSGFAIEIFPDGSLQTQMSLMHGHQDGVTRRWHATGQLESEQGFRCRRGATEPTGNGGPTACLRCNRNGTPGCRR